MMRRIRNGLACLAVLSGVSIALPACATPNTEGANLGTDTAVPPNHTEVQCTANGRPVVLVASGKSGTVTIIDATDRTVLKRINVIPDGGQPSVQAGDPPDAATKQAIISKAAGDNFAQDLDVSPDGRTLYVSRGHRADVAAFSIATGALMWKVAIPGLRADHMTIHPDGTRLYVSDQISGTTADQVHAIDTATHRIVGSAPTGQRPHDNHITPDGKLLYNSSTGATSPEEEPRDALPQAPYQLTVIDPSTMKVLRAFTFDRGIRPMAHTHDGQTMYAQRSEESSIMKVRLSDGALQEIVHLKVKEGTTPADYDRAAPHHGLALAGDESTLCVAGRVSDYVGLVRTDTLDPVAYIDVPDAPGWATTGPDGTSCWVTSTRADSVSVVSYDQRSEIARIPVPGGPKLAQPARLPADIFS